MIDYLILSGFGLLIFLVFAIAIRIEKTNLNQVIEQKRQLLNILEQKKYERAKDLNLIRDDISQEVERAIKLIEKKIEDLVAFQKKQKQLNKTDKVNEDVQ